MFQVVVNPLGLRRPRPAMALLRELQDMELKSNIIAYNAAMSACLEPVLVMAHNNILTLIDT